MDRSEALRLLQSERTRERLDAARFLAAYAEPEDEPVLRSALAKDRVSWIAASLHRSIRTANRTRPDLDQGSSPEDELARAVAESTAKIVHEIAPILGALRLYASREVEDYESSRTAIELGRLQNLLAALDNLGRAAGSPSFVEVALSDLISDLADSIEDITGVTIRRTGPTPFKVLGDRALIDLVLRNALLNAAESAQEAESDQGVVLSWGDTDIDYWISVMDSGIGLPPARSGIREIGTTTKLGHLGMGLAVASQACESMGGSIELTDRDGGGVRFEFRWPKDGFG